MKILIFGAAFDPPHLGHMTMATQVVEHAIADKVIFVPCGNHAFNKNMSEAEDRLKMTDLAVSEIGKNHFEVSSIEIEREGISFTIDTLNDFSKANPDDEIGWLMGSDQLKNFSKWERYEEILAKYPVYVYPRKGYKIEGIMTGMVPLGELPMIEISSTEIRDDVANHREFGHKVPALVKEYIILERLWKK